MERIKPEKMLIFDVETTGLNAGSDHIIEFSAIDGNGETLLSTYVNPGAKTLAKGWPGAEHVNHISPDMVKDSPTMADLKEQVDKLFDGADLLIAYNGGFDIGFLRGDGIEIDTNKPYYDVMFEFAPIYGEWSDYFFDYKWQKLITAAAYFGYDWGSDLAHDSCADCRATLYVYHKLQERENGSA